MNYRHAYHAGNHGDVVKHAVLALILAYLNKKEAPWRFIDTHAGLGQYDLEGEAALKTGEWREGIGRLAPHLGLLPRAEERALSGDVLLLLAPFAETLRSVNADGTLRFYPGSPAVARALARPQDRLMLCELHGDDGALLAALYLGDQQVKVRRIDGWLALNAFVPPKERRGLVLVDPPFEAPGEFGRLVDGLAAAAEKWPTGMFLLWHPVKDGAAVAAYERGMRTSGLPRLLLAEVMVRGRTGTRFDGSGLVILNPPWTLKGELDTLLPALAGLLAQGPGAGARTDWLTGTPA